MQMPVSVFKDILHWQKTKKHMQNQEEGQAMNQEISTQGSAGNSKNHKNREWHGQNQNNNIREC